MLFLKNFKTALQNLLAKNDRIQPEAAMDSLRRFRLMVPFILMVNIVYTLEFWFHSTGKESAVRAQWANGIGWSHFVMGCCMIVLWPMLQAHCKRNQYKGWSTILLQFIFCVVCLGFGASLSLFDQLITTNTTNFVIVSMLVAMSSLMRPLLSIALYGLGLGLFFTLIPLTQNDPDLVNLARSHTMGAIVLTVISSGILWRQYVIAALLRVQLAERNIQLRDRTNDLQNMLQNLPQGVLTIGRGGSIHPEYSAFLEEIFETKNITGVPVMDLVFSNTNLGSDVLNQIATTVVSCIGDDRLNYNLNSHILVTECARTMNDGRIKALDFTWSPIYNPEGFVERLMLCVRDVTELKKVRAESRRQKREIEIIGQILDIGQEKFHGFLQSSNKFLEENESLVRKNKSLGDLNLSDKNIELVNQLFRNMHSIKGNARTYGFLDLTNLVHRVENTYDQLRKNPEAPTNHDLLLGDLKQIQQTLQEYAQINESKLGRRSLNPVGVEKIQDTLQNVIGSLASLAIELGKEPPMVKINDGNISIKSQVSDLLKNVFVHLFRNSVDHGLEPANRRIAKGKSPSGQITLDLTMDQNRLWFKLQDDGRGLALDLIKNKAKKMAEATEHEIAQWLFLPGVSTAEVVTEISGRGVGLDVVKNFLEREGGTIEIILREPKPNDANGLQTYRPFYTLVSLPAKYGIQSPP